MHDRLGNACSASDVTAHHDVFQDAHIAKDLQILEGTGDAPPRPLERWQMVDTLAIEFYLAGVGSGDAGDHVEQGALAGTIWTNHRFDLAGANVEAQIRDGRHAVEMA